MHHYRTLQRVWCLMQPRVPTMHRCKALEIRYLVHRACNTQTAQDSGTASDVPREPTPDKYELFVNPQVQSLLRKLTDTNPKKSLPDHTSIKKSREVTLYTKEQLMEAEREAGIKAFEMTAMPPVLPIRTECEEVLSADPGIKGFAEHTHVFIDTTLGLPERDRNITMRSPDGTLRSASWEVRDRVSQIFYPRSGRRIKPASLLYGENLKRLLSEKRYKYLLDSACCQFEPDHPQYIHITQQVYEHADANESYETLQFTRHYGPMIFNYILHKQILNIMKYLIRCHKLTDCLHIARIYSIVWSIEDLVPPADSAPSSEQAAYIKEFLSHEKLMDSDLSHELDVVMKKMLFEQMQHMEHESTDHAASDSDSSSSSSDSDGESSSDGEDNRDT